LALESGSEIQERIVPAARIRSIGGIGHIREQVCIRYLVFIGEELMEEDGSHIRLQIHGRLLKGEGKNAGCGSGTDAGQGDQLFEAVRQLGAS
jgi:hypothetical protein